MGVRMRHPDIEAEAAELGRPAYPETGYPEMDSEEQIIWHESRGWVRVPEDTDDPDDFSALKAADLKMLVAERGLLPASNRKDDLIAALEADRQLRSEAPSPIVPDESQPPTEPPDSDDTVTE